MESRDKISALIIGGTLFIVVVMLAVTWFTGWRSGQTDASDIQEKGYSIQFVSNTEYAPGQDGQISVVVIDYSGAPVTDEFTCSHTILYPNKTLFESGPMLANTSIGTQYVTFTVPDTEGVYEYASNCAIDNADVIITFEDTQIRPDANITAVKSFHVSRPTNKKLRASVTQ